jgi:hypothetical protein
MGHKTIQMTMRYAHLAPEHNLAAVERLVSFNSSKPPVKGTSRAQTAVLEEAAAISSATASRNEVLSAAAAVN